MTEHVLPSCIITLYEHYTTCRDVILTYHRESFHELCNRQTLSFSMKYHNVEHQSREYALYYNAKVTCIHFLCTTIKCQTHMRRLQFSFIIFHIQFVGISVCSLFGNVCLGSIYIYIYTYKLVLILFLSKCTCKSLQWTYALSALRSAVAHHEGRYMKHSSGNYPSVSQ